MDSSGPGSLELRCGLRTASGGIVAALAELCLLFGVLIVKGEMGWHSPANPLYEGELEPSVGYAG